MKTDPAFCVLILPRLKIAKPFCLFPRRKIMSDLHANLKLGYERDEIRKKDCPKMALHKLMVDIETMSTHNSNALIVSVAAVQFSLLADGPVYGEQEVWALDIGEQLLMGRRVDPDTQKFWASQPGDASQHWREPAKVPRTIGQFKNGFISLLDGVTEMWAHGVAFDIGNLASLWDVPPWKYNSVMDVRTVVHKMPVLPGRGDYTGGIKHDPLSDCYAQIHALWQRNVL